jgi:hypothetical protein
MCGPEAATEEIVIGLSNLFAACLSTATNSFRTIYDSGLAIQNSQRAGGFMDGRGSVASLLLSIVVALPCTRKLICAPQDEKLSMPATAPRRVPVPAPAPVLAKPAAAASEKTKKTGRCTMHTSTTTGQRTVVRTVENTI